MRKICRKALILVVCVSVVLGTGFVQGVRADVPDGECVVVQPFNEGKKDCD